VQAVAEKIQPEVPWRLAVEIEIDREKFVWQYGLNDRKQIERN